MKLYALIGTLSALFLSGCGGDDDPDVSQALNETTPSIQQKNVQLTDLSESHYGHIYTQKAEKLKLTHDDVIQLQTALQQKLLGVMPKAQQQKISDLQQEFAQNKAFQDPQSQLLFNTAITQKLLTEVNAKITLQFPYHRYHRILRRQVFDRVRIRDIRSILPLRDYLRDRGLLDHLIPKHDGDYIQQCRDASVPIPPDWGSSQWNYIGDQNRTFIGTTLRTEVWAYKNAHGTCVALPRVQGSDNIQLLGIICQSTQTGQACFWDNIDNSTERRLTGEDAVNMRIADLQNANTLDENCTDCHRGQNVFLIHPNETIDISSVGYDLIPDIRYQPLSTQAAWQNPTAHSELGDGMCASCHEIPALSRSYCNSVLSQAASMTMPNVTNPAGWPASAGSYKTHLDALRADCP